MTGKPAARMRNHADVFTEVGLPEVAELLEADFPRLANSARLAGEMTSSVLPNREVTQSLRLKLARLQAVRICRSRFHQLCVCFK